MKGGGKNKRREREEGEMGEKREKRVVERELRSKSSLFSIPKTMK